MAIVLVLVRSFVDVSFRVGATSLNQSAVLPFSVAAVSNVHFTLAGTRMGFRSTHIYYQYQYLLIFRCLFVYFFVCLAGGIRAGIGIGIGLGQG